MYTARMFLSQNLEMQKEDEPCGLGEAGKICGTPYGLCEKGLYCHKVGKSCGPGTCKEKKGIPGGMKECAHEQ